MLVDCLAHLLDPRVSDLASLLERARAADLTDIVHAGVDPLSDTVWCGPTRPGLQIWLAFGIHPMIVGRRPLREQLRALRQKLKSPHVVAIGECGLDNRPNMPPMGEQLDAFAAQLELAGELDLPLILHQVRASSPFFQLLNRREFTGVRAMVHGYSASVETARELVAKGIYISFGAGITSERYRRARQSLMEVPEHLLLVESDTPDHPPDGSMRSESEPADIISTLQTMAMLRERPVVELAWRTAANAAELFRWSAPTKPAEEEGNQTLDHSAGNKLNS